MAADLVSWMSPAFSLLSPTVPSVAPVIDYADEFAFEVPPSDLWDAIEHVDRFERWWPWLREFSLEGGSLVAGSVMHGVVVPPLPYRMQVDVDLVRCTRPRSIDALVHGDLEGTAQLRLHPTAGGTLASVAWRIEMMQRPMRLASRLAHPVLEWGHGRVVDLTVAGFRRHLERGD